MHDIMFMELADANNNLCHVELDQDLMKWPLFREETVEVTTTNIWHDEV